MAITVIVREPYKLPVEESYPMVGASYDYNINIKIWEGMERVDTMLKSPSGMHMNTKLTIGSWFWKGIPIPRMVGLVLRMLAHDYHKCQPAVAKHILEDAVMLVPRKALFLGGFHHLSVGNHSGPSAYEYMNKPCHITPVGILASKEEILATEAKLMVQCYKLVSGLALEHIASPLKLYAPIQPLIYVYSGMSVQQLVDLVGASIEEDPYLPQRVGVCGEFAGFIL